MEKIVKNRVTVAGLGSMGVKLVELLAGAGYNVTAWNRTAAKGDKLTNAAFQPDLTAAIGAGDSIIICVYDHAAVMEIFNAVTGQEVLRGKTVINFTTGSPAEARAIAAWLKVRGAVYVQGALQVAPDQMGLPDTTILLSGAAFEAAKPILDVFGGNLQYLGEEAGLASAADLATLAWLYGSYTGLMYGVEMARKAGLPLARFASILGGITPGFTEFFKHQVGVIQSGDFEVSQSPMTISIAAVQRIRDTFAQTGVKTDFWDSINGLLKTAQQQGLDKQELAALVKVL